MAEVFKKSSQVDFYINTYNEINFSCSPIKEVSQNEIKLQIGHYSQTYDLIIKNYKFGIIQILIDFPDKSIRYKNNYNNDVGLNLIKKNFEDINIKENLITLITEDDEEDNFPYGKFSSNLNKYKLIINLSNFEIEYYINEDLLMVFNKQKMLNLLNNKEKNLKSNVFDFSYNNIIKCFGLPERNSPFFLPDDTYRSFNVDNPFQKVGDNQCLYGSVPILYGINDKNIVGVFNDNTSDQFIELKTDNNNRNIKWITEGGIINLYLISDNIIERVLHKFYKITGKSPMAPIWAFGYHHCRWGFENDADVMNVSNKFDELKIPFDCIWIDIDHTDDKKYFTWNPVHFKNIKPFLQKLKDNNRYFVTIIDPHLKAKDDYDISKKLKDEDCLVKEKNSKGELINYVGHCWPGSSYYGDFINYEKLLKQYKEFYKKEDYFMGFNNFGSWVDMNEPSVFDDRFEKTMPKNNIHFDGKQLVEHREIHNIYGYFYQKVAYNSLLNRFDNKVRPFILSRSYYAGCQKNGWIWTGDQGASYDFMNTSIELNYVNGFCGISGCGTDVGGFLNSPTPELLKTWYDLGILYVFFRGHSAFNTIRREPWLFNDEVKNSIIDSINIRYNLLMFFYTKFYEYTLHGVNIIKPLWMLFHNKNKMLFNKSLNIKEQGSIFIVGKEIMAINMNYITDEGIKILNDINSNDFLLYDLFNGNILNNKFIKDKNLMTKKIALGGSVIPWTEKNEKCAYYVMREPIGVKIFLDEKKEARGYYYFDDGITYDNEGHYAYVEILVKEKNINIRNINVSNDVGSGKIKDIIPIWNFIELYGFNDKINKVLLEENESLNYEIINDNGIKIDLLKKNIKVFNPVNIIIK